MHISFMILFFAFSTIAFTESSPSVFIQAWGVFSHDNANNNKVFLPSDETHLELQGYELYLKDIDSNTSFGVCFFVGNSGPKKRVEIEFRIVSPKLINPETREESTVHSYRQQIKMNQSYYWGFQFNQKWERIPGDWIFEMWIAGKLESKSVFTIVEGSCPENTTCYNELVSNPDKDAKFPGGQYEMAEFLQDHLTYPEIAKQDKISGTVHIYFIVERDGSLSDVKCVSGGDQPLIDEAIRVVKLMPKWEPAELNKFPVRVSYVIPITFSL